jgi:hypothetical protein
MRSRFLYLMGLCLVLFSACQKETSFEVGNPARGSLQSAAGDCLPKNIGGTFIASQATADSNYMEVTLSITQSGTYTVYTDTLNGYFFRGTGTVTATGTQLVKLKAFGTPGGAGTNNFTVIFDTTACFVPVTVLAAGSGGSGGGGGGGGGGVSSGEYFPLTQASWWSYDDGMGSDSIKTVNSGTGTYVGNTYQRFITFDKLGAPLDTAYYRKDAAANVYYNYVSTATLAAAGIPVTFTQPGLDVLFLKNVLTTGATWNSDHAGNVGGFPVTLRFKFTCLDGNLTTTVNGKSFTNVYKVELQPQLGTGATFTNATTPSQFYYSKGIGLIWLSTPVDDQKIRFWNVN